MKTWRLIVNPPADGYTNMAIDEALLASASQASSQPTLRIYAWSPPAFSLGYFQRAEEVLDIKRCQQDGIVFVRRLTGGSLLFHHKEVTYSLVGSPDKLGLNKSVKDGFKRICGFLLKAYHNLGLKANFAIDSGFQRSHPPSHLCLASYEPYDIVVNGKKLGGNAQKRRRNFVFQHGSIPLSVDFKAFSPYLKKPPLGLEGQVGCLSELLHKEVSFDEIAWALIKAFETHFEVKLQQEDLSPLEWNLARELRESKYRTLAWNLKY